ncbi:MAG: response regulator transcription factor [Flavobacteriales bacterium]|nr:response regulator transcription factor [Flavobacteriales bacterium]MDW8432914.1 response regulator transcription factor [Flavobacteriales bacterium]
MKRILLVEDDQILHNNIEEALKAVPYHVEALASGYAAEKKIKSGSYDLAILDVGLPGISGFELCRLLKKRAPATPVLFLTAYDDLESKIIGFESGADDYLTKPFFMRELLLRVNALLRRPVPEEEKGPDADIIQFDDIMLHLKHKKVFRQNREIPLTPREFHLLYSLLRHPGELVSKSQLLREVWGSAVGSDSNSVEVYINFLRNKLDKPFGRNTIRTRPGYGYYLEKECG